MMSKFIPPYRQVEPKWRYMANPQTGEVVKIGKSDFAKQYEFIDKGYGYTSRDIFERSRSGLGSIRRSFTPTEYPTGSGRYVPANIYFNIKL
jgi:hypothetical protein